MKKSGFLMAVFSVLALTALAWPNSADESGLQEHEKPKLKLPSFEQVRDFFPRRSRDHAWDKAATEGRAGLSPESSSTESVYLREIAARLGIDEPGGKTPGDIALDIGQRLEACRTYRGAILSEESFEKACAAIRIPADRETFKAYHEFIGEIAGKKILILEETE